MSSPHKPHAQQSIAAVDVGTNTIRLWIGRILGREIHTLHSDMASVRLGEGLEQTGMISEEAATRAAAVLTHYRDVAGQEAVRNLRAVGTSVFRRAVNGKDAAAFLYARTGLPIDVVSGEEEARLCVKGILWGLSSPPGPVLMADVGGGSTELIVANNAGIEAIRSLDCGAVYLSEAYLKHDPPLETEMEDLQAHVVGRLTAITRCTPFDQITPRDHLLIGTAGTATTLAAMDLELRSYAAHRVHGHILTLDTLLALLERLKTMKARDRLYLPGIDKGREDIILAGLLVWVVVLRTFAYQEMLVSHNGILEGLAIDLWERNGDYAERDNRSVHV